MAYNFVADSIHTKKLCSRLSSSEVQSRTENSRFAFLACFGAYGQLLILGSLENTWTGLPISVNRTFSVDVTVEALRANID